MTCPTKALAGCWKISPAAFSHRSDPQRTPRVRLGPLLAVALLDGFFEQPAGLSSCCTSCADLQCACVPT